MTGQARLTIQAIAGAVAYTTAGSAVPLRMRR
jgi:hypothetical protein